jgi:hypothetical protein
MIIFLLCGCAGLPGVKNIEVFDEGDFVAGGLQDTINAAAYSRLPDYEKLTYEVKWLGLKIGTLTTSITGIKNYKGRDVYVLEATMKTDDFFARVYKIEDRFVSYLDVEKLYTLHHEVYRRDGSYRKDAVTEFDQINHKAYFKNFIDNSEKIFDIPIGTHDILSACYYFMVLPLKLGGGVNYYVCNNENNYHFYGFVRSKATIKLPALAKEKREAILLEPYAKLKGKKVDKGRVSAYFSADKRRLPLMATVKGPIFTEVTISLVKIE